MVRAPRPRRLAAAVLLALALAARALTLPPLRRLSDPGLEGAHSFSRTASWAIPGLVLCGHYPGSCPSRPAADDVVSERLADIRAAGVGTFVCLQDEIPPQDAPWPDGGVARTNFDRAPLATAPFKNYGAAAARHGPLVSFAHFGLPDLSVAESLDALDAIVGDLHRRLVRGERLYIHCWGGRGRTGLVAACLLGALYAELDAEHALLRVQSYYELREPSLKKSPETEEQRQQVRDWYSKRRSARAPPPPLEAFGIWDSGGSQMLERVGAGSDPPDVRPAEERSASPSALAEDADLLGSGQFGKVFRGRRLSGVAGASVGGAAVAIKVMPVIVPDGATPDAGAVPEAAAPSHERSRIALEASVLRAVRGERGFPALLHDGRQAVFGQDSDVLVMSLLGEPVYSLCPEPMCEDGRFTTAAVLKIGHDALRSLRSLHAARFVHNDVKPQNLLFGAAGSANEDDVHLVDFGMTTVEGECQEEFVEGCELAAGGGTPLFASVAQLEGRPTAAVDDVESLWYVLAFLAEGALPWQWEPRDRVTHIKQRLFDSECAVNSDTCDAQLASDECCSTAHCLATYSDWDVSDRLHGLWDLVLEAHGGGSFDYERGLRTLSADYDPLDLE